MTIHVSKGLLSEFGNLVMDHCEMSWVWFIVCVYVSAISVDL